MASIRQPDGGSGPSLIPARVGAENLGSWSAHWYRVGIATVAVIAALSLGLSAVHEAAARSAEHSRTVVRNLRNAVALASDRETGIRGYLLSHDSLFLQPEFSARVPLKSALETLVTLSQGDSQQMDRANSLRSAHTKWDSAFVQDALGDMSVKRTADEEMRLLFKGKQLFDDIRIEATRFLDAEEMIYTQRKERERLIRWLSASIAVLALIVVALVLRSFRVGLVSQSSQLIEQQRSLEEQAVELEQHVEELQSQAQELEESNSQLRSAITVAATAQEAAHVAHTEGGVTERRLQVVLEGAPLAIAIVDRDRKVEMLNPAFAAIAGSAPQATSSFRGRELRDVLPDLAGTLDASLDHVVGGNVDIDRFEVSTAVEELPGARTERHQTRTWSGSVYPIHDAAGGVVGAGVMLLELTEQRKLEAQFRQAQRMEAVGRLTGGIAHDFNNILTGIAGFSELAAARTPPDSPQFQDLKQVQLATQRATTLVRQLMAFSRQQVMQPKVLDLNAVVAELEPLLHRVLGEDVRYRSNLAKNVWTVLADPGQVEQVLMNLAVNARDAMASGGSLTIETRNVQLDSEYPSGLIETPPGEYVQLSVSDTGQGMDEATLAKAFEPFFTTKPLGRGTGLGLSTVYGIIKQSGGTVRIYSEPGHGTTFKIYLPHHDGVPVNLSTPQSAPAVHDGHATILLVEDDEVVALVARRVLEEYGYKVLIAPNGRAALDLFKQRDAEIDLVITDLVMPEIGGRELVEQLRAMGTRVRIIYMSGYTAEAVNQQSVLPDDAVFLEKPFRPADLLGQVRRLLSAT